MNRTSPFRRARPITALIALAIWGCTDAPTDAVKNRPVPVKPAFAAGGSISVNLDQCANDPRTSPCTWQNGDLNGSNSVYSEDLTVPFRLGVGGLAIGQSYEFHINYDWTAGGHKAYDFLASYNATENVPICAAGGGGVPQVCSGGNPQGSLQQVDFQADPFGEPVNSPTVTVDGAIAFSTFVTAGERKLTGYGVSGLSTSQPRHVDNQGNTITSTADLAGNTEGDIIVTFTATAENVLFLWSGHLAQSPYWNSPSDPDGAGQVNGAPWHMRTQQLQTTAGTSAGNKNQDRSIQPSALITADANIQISASGVNEVGVHHLMTGHVNINAGAGFVNAPDGTVITFAIASGPGIIVGTNSATTALVPPQCTTSGGTGSCTVYLYSTAAGLTTVNASTSVTVNGAPLIRSTNGTAPNSGPLTKRWVDAKISLSPLTATNVLGDPHTVTVTVEQDDGFAEGAQGGDAATGFTPSASRLVTFTLLNNTAGATFTTQAPFTCTTSASGQCTITITAATAGGVDIHATTTFTLGGVSLTRATGTGGNNSADAHKDYTSGSIAWTKVDGDGIALGGATFEYKLLPSGTPVTVVDNSAPDADNTAGSFKIVGLAIGTYEVKETAPPPGLGYNMDPAAQQITITAQAPFGTAAVAFVNPKPKAKIVLSPLTATNALGQEHVVTATVSQDDGLANPAGDGVNGYTASGSRLVTFSLLNNTAGADFKNAVNTCTTNSSGQCTITLTSTQPGSVNIHATTSVTVGAVTIQLATNGLGDNSGDAQKTWTAGSIAWTKVKGDGTTKLGGAVFEYQVQGSGNWIEVTDDVDGAPTPGVDKNGAAGEFLVTGLSAGTYEVREKTAPAGYNKDPDTEVVTLGPGTSSAELNKTITTAFVDPAPKAKIILSPLTATNEINSAHTITATVSQDDGLAAGLGGDATDGYVAAVGKTVTFSLANNSAGAAFTTLAPFTCTTDGSGQCTIAINTSTPGSVDIHATTTFTIGSVSVTATTGAGGDNSADANKVYVDAKIAVSPLTATNVVGEQHTITATVNKDVGAGFVAASGVTVTFSLANNTAGASFTTSAPFECTTNGSGQCSIIIQATQAGSVDIHATTTFSINGVSLTRATGTGGNNSADANKVYVTGSIAWSKNDQNGNPLGGATFRYRLSPAGNWISVTDNSSPDADPAAGKFKILGLSIGTYDVEETQAPAGYTLDATPKQATITHDAPDAVISVAFVNSTGTRGQILPTQTTCSDFAFGNPAVYTQIFAGVKGNTINNVSPGVVFYYTEVIAPAASFQIGITQSNNKSFPALQIQQNNQVSLYNPDCSNRAATISVQSGTATIAITGATVGAKYIVGVKYDTGSPVGQQANKLPVMYSFGTTVDNVVVGSNAATLQLVKR